MSECIFREQDDNDGNKDDGLHLIIGDDGDFFISTHDSMDSLRFRMPVLGGGKSPNTWFALRHLFNAMKEDNQQNNAKQLELPFENDSNNFDSVKNQHTRNKIIELIDSIDDIADSPDIIKERLEMIINTL